MTDLVTIKQEVQEHLANPETLKTLVNTTFKGLKPDVVPVAITEGMMRGFTFKDFLEKNIYAIPFGSTYSLITSIDHARKIGMRSGVIGKSAPKYTFYKDGKIESCTITIRRKAHGEVGEYSETVYFTEYSTGRNLWNTKPKTMIAKVAEMHALRMACPEEMSQIYVQEEKDQETTTALPEIKVEEHKKKLEEAKDLEELKTTWASIPAPAKKELEPVKDDLKMKFVEDKTDDK